MVLTFWMFVVLADKTRRSSGRQIRQLENLNPRSEIVTVALKCSSGYLGVALFLATSREEESMLFSAHRAAPYHVSLIYVFMKYGGETEQTDP